MSPKNIRDHFDDDFEVTYEDDPLFHFESSDNRTAPRKFRTIDLKNPDAAYTRTLDIPLKNDKTVLMDPVTAVKDRSRRTSSWEEEPAVRSRHFGHTQKTPRKRTCSSERSIPNLLGPVQSTAKYGGKVIYKITSILLRLISLLLVISTAGFMAWNFWKGSAPYGDPATAVAEKNYCLAAYACVAALFLFIEVVSFFWAMTRVRLYNNGRIVRKDTGRGLSSFVLIYLCSYAAFWLNRIVPDSHEILRGIRGGLEVFGSMHNTLFGLCLAGVVSCLIRKFLK